MWTLIEVGYILPLLLNLAAIIWAIISADVDDGTTWLHVVQMTLFSLIPIFNWVVVAALLYALASKYLDIPIKRKK